MCGRYNLITDAQALIDAFEVGQLQSEASEIKPRYNIAPSQLVPIIRYTDKGRELALAKWGLVPYWSKEPRTKYSTINARAETVAEKPTYRDAFKHRRCLVPATGFYEWRQTGGGKVPHHIRMKGNGLFAFAGLWEHWEKEGKALDSCAIIVTDADSLLRPIHDRMPVILDKEDYDLWLDGSADKSALLRLLKPYGGGRLNFHQISRRVNDPTNDDVGCIEPVVGR